MNRKQVLQLMSDSWREYVHNLKSPDEAGVENAMNHVLNKLEKTGLYYKKETIECHVDGVKYVYTEEKLGND